MISQLLTRSISAILIENFIFVRFLGICPFLGVSKKLDTALGMGLSVVFIMGITSVMTWLVNTFILIPFNMEYMQTTASILVIAAMVQLVEFVLQKKMPALYHAFGIYLPLISTNCAVLGVTLLNVQRQYNLLFSMTFGISAALGFMLAMLLFAAVRERVELGNIPRCFQGFPITLITAALLAIAFMGFQGLKLPF